MPAFFSTFFEGKTGIEIIFSKNFYFFVDNYYKL